MKKMSRSKYVFSNLCGLIMIFSLVLGVSDTFTNAVLVGIVASGGALLLTALCTINLKKERKERFLINKWIIRLYAFSIVSTCIIGIGFGLMINSIGNTLPISIVLLLVGLLGLIINYYLGIKEKNESAYESVENI